MNNYSNDERTFSYLAYIGPLCLIGLFSDLRSNPTLRFHLNQGLVLFLCEMVALIIHSIINTLIGGIFLLNIIPAFLFTFIGLCSLALSLIGIFNVATNKLNILPFIGSINILR